MLIVVGVLVTVVSAAPQRNASRIKRDRQATERQIAETSRKIDENSLNVERQLNQLNLVTAEIEEYNRSIIQIQKSVDSIESSIKKMTDSISSIDKSLSQMRDKYATAVRKMQSNKGDLSTLAFVFSAESFSQAYRRLRYLQQFSQWKTRKSEEIKSVQVELEKQREKLSVMQDSKNHTLIKLNETRRELQRKSTETRTLVVNLEKEGKTLKKLLKRKEKEAQALDEELERLIEEQRIAEENRRKEEERQKKMAEERKRQEEIERQKRIAQEQEQKRKEEAQRKEQEAKQKKTGTEKPVDTATKTTKKKDDFAKQAEQTVVSQEKSAPVVLDESKLTVQFEQSKGKLPLPIKGKYKIVRGFGVNQHPELKYVKTKNSGIDIETQSGADAYAIFPGRVSEIFRQAGYNNIVMVRHGSYITIYTNLSTITVKKGDVVEANQKLGQVYVDTTDGNRSLLHFEIRLEKTKLNPQEWLGIK